MKRNTLLSTGGILKEKRESERYFMLESGINCVFFQCDVPQ